MRLSVCKGCDQIVYFDNTSCTRCGAVLGFVTESLEVKSFTEIADNAFKLVDDNHPSESYRRCANGVMYNVCNWMVKASDSHDLCLACRLNRTIPDLSVPDNFGKWLKIENEKRRLIYSLLVLQLPIEPVDSHLTKLAFDFLADTEDPSPATEKVMTGYGDGIITLNINEADDVFREKTRVEMGEPYRTLLGHFRHESGHHYWNCLVRVGCWLKTVRAVFGDDTADYQSALQAYYSNGAPSNWQDNYISAYASSHPWEDWAETWAHYLFIIDTLETAHEYELHVKPHVSDSPDHVAYVKENPYDSRDFQSILKYWLPVSNALNSLGSSMGHDPLYPYILAEPVIKKLDLVHRIIHHAR